MRSFLVRVLAWIGALTVVSMVGFFVLVAIALSHRPSIPRSVILETELQRGLLERKDQGFFEGLSREKPTVRDVVDALARAGSDERVKVLVSDLSNVTAGFAQLQEIRDAVLAFRKKGKHAVAFADTFGELSPANGAYYLASAYDEVYLQPSGAVGLTGLAIEMPFAKDLLTDLHVQASFFKRHEYKSAPEMFTENAPSQFNKEEVDAWLSSSMSQLVKGVAEGRHLDEAKVRALVDEGPFLAEEAVKAKLIDGLAYRDEIYAKVKTKAGDEAKTLYLGRYLERAGRLNADAADRVALIFGTGTVERGGPGGELSSKNMRSGDVAAAFREAVADKRVKAIVFRIDSPGGSYVASDTIRRAVQVARLNGKPVIASMGDTAASGGYFVAMDADKVVAQPGTVTGSIGVFAGKFITEGFWSKIGVHWAAISKGANATMMSTSTDFTSSQKARMNAWLDAVYADFTGKAAEGRHLPLAKLQQVAKGRIWTGEDAKKIGLVDALGGMNTALQLAKEAAKLTADAPVRVEVYPAEKTPVEQLARLLEGPTGENSDDETSLPEVEWPEPPAVRELHNAARRVGVLDPQKRGVLSAPPPEVSW